MTDLRYVTLGAVALTERRLTRAARATVGATRAIGGTVVGLGLPLVPAAVRRTVADLGRELDQQGRSVVAGGTRELGRLSEEVADGLGRNPNVLRLVEQVVEQIQWQVVDTVLPAVLERLAAEPEQVRAIVQGQSPPDRPGDPPGVPPDDAREHAPGRPGGATTSTPATCPPARGSPSTHSGRPGRSGTHSPRR